MGISSWYGLNIRTKVEVTKQKDDVITGANCGADTEDLHTDDAKNRHHVIS